jgi:transcription elongation factor GreA
MIEEKKIPLTEQAVERLKNELAQLEGVRREQIIEEIARARAHGDLSENAEYHAAKDQQGMQEARARQIRQMLQNAEIIRTEEEDGIAGPGKLVTIRYEGDDESETYLLGLREEKGAGHDVLTPDSPIGKALLGHTAGEMITANAPRGRISVRLLDVRNP